METSDDKRVDHIGPWSEIKLDLIEEYVKVWATILGAKKQAARYRTIYIDAFAGAGVNRSRATDAAVFGSPLRALSVEPKLHEYVFIEKDEGKHHILESHCSQHPGLSIDIRLGDCNEILLKEILPRFKMDRSLRGLLLMDPYGLHYDWKVIETAGRTGAIDLILNFPMSDALRNALRRRPDQLHTRLRRRWVRAWGAQTWDELYNPCLFNGDPHFADLRKRLPERDIARAYHERIRKVAGFNLVSQPFLLQNSQNSTMFHLFLASQKPVAIKVMDYIVNKYKKRESHP